MQRASGGLIVALDLGTTGNRALLYGANGRPLAQAYREFTQYFPKPGWVEHDPMEIVASTRRVLRQVLAAAHGKRIAGLGITNQRETAVLWDRQTGKPVHRAIVWQCRRTTEQCARLAKRGLQSWVQNRTGLFLDPYFSASKWQWLLDHVPGARQKARDGKLLAGTIDSWILWNLTGGKEHATDPSNASRTMLWNIREARWDKELLKLFHVPAGLMPEVKDTVADFGVTDEAFAGMRIPVRAMIGDQQASMFAQGCWSPGMYKNTYGTGLFLMTHTGHTPHNAKSVISTVAWKLGKKIEYALEGSIFIGGAAVQWLRDGLRILRHAGQTQGHARSLASNEGVYFVPGFVGLGAPHWDPNARGMLIGITRGTRREHLIRAALESMAYQSAELAEEMAKELHAKPKMLFTDGGASRNDFLMQFQADILGCPVALSAQTEATALGAAYLAGMGAELWERPQIKRWIKPARVFRPRMPQPEAKELLRHWKRAVARAKGWVDS